MEFIDLKTQYNTYKDEIDSSVHKCMSNADFIMGKNVEEFEKSLAEYIGVKYSISCGSGTDALQLIYMTLGIGKGDAVFCPDVTFIASIEPACFMGATPVFCDIDSNSFNISPESLEIQINNVIKEGKLKPKAVVAVDFLGNPAEYDRLREITNKYGMILIEDSAQGTGSLYKGIKCGSLGDIGATSFFPSKPLGCYGDGGAVFTNDEETMELLKSFRVHGKGFTKYDNVRIGINSRLDTIQAGILDIKLKYLQGEISKRQVIANRYIEAFKGLIKMQSVSEENISSYAQFVIILNNEKERNELKSFLLEREIPSLIYYPKAMHSLPVFREIKCYDEKYDNSIKYSECNLGLPFSAFLDENDQIRVIEIVKDFLQNR